MKGCTTWCVGLVLTTTAWACGGGKDDGTATFQNPTETSPASSADNGDGDDESGGDDDEDDGGSTSSDDDGESGGESGSGDTGDGIDIPDAPFGLCAEAPPAGAPVPPPPPTYSGGPCPAISPGYVTDFLSAGRTREFAFVVPSNYDPAHSYPLVFAWYHLSGNAMEFIEQLGAQDLADITQAIFVVPQDTGDFEFVWPDTPLDVGQSGVDLGLFDDIYACVTEQYSVNTSCVASAGVSAGGLWTSYLGQQRGQYLASNVVLSGGLPTEFGAAWWNWTASPHTFSSLVLWGGPSDMLIINFHEAALNYINHLSGDGHFILQCEHTGGHGLPPPDMDGDPPPFEVLFEFVLNHPYWYHSGMSPYIGDLPENLPSYCGIG